MKAKRISTGEEVEVSEQTFTSMKTGVVHRRDIKNGGFIAESDLKFLSDTPEKVTIEGYVARGANPHHLALYERKPERLSDIWGFSHSLQLDPTFFPEITWENSPKRVKITITPME